MPLLQLTTVLVFACVGLVVYAAGDMLFSEDRRVSKRLKGLTEYERAQAIEAEPLLASFSRRVILPAASSVARGVRLLWPAGYRDRLGERLSRAGYPRGLAADRFLIAKVLGSLGTALLVAGFSTVSGTRVGVAVFTIVCLSGLAFFIPDFWLDQRIRTRQHKIAMELPDMLDMLTISVEAGLGFDAALSKLVRNSKGPLAQEFSRMLAEVQAGSTRKAALRALAERIDVTEISSFVASIVQADMFGVSIAHVLRTQAAEMRLKRKQRAEEEAQKAPVKMVFPLVICILPATIIVILAPAAIKIAQMFAQ